VAISSYCSYFLCPHFTTVALLSGSWKTIFNCDARNAQSCQSLSRFFISVA